MTEQWSAQQVYDYGEFFSMISTICGDFIPQRGLGSRVFGEFSKSGKSGWLLDFSSGYSTVALGYHNPVIREAIIKQMDTGIIQMPSHDWHSEQPVRLKKKLCEIAPVKKPAKVFLCNSGTEAIEAALKACQARRHRQKERRPKLLSFQGSFHGRSSGALSINNRKPIYKEGFQTSHISDILPFPHKYDPESIDKFERALDNFVNPHLINACFLELVQGEGGIRVINKNSLHHLVTFCRNNDIYLVVDEIQTGLMRCGRMFASEHFGIKPDIICLAKALGGGWPLGAIIANDQFNFEPGQHSCTFGGTPAICVASLALIDELEKLNNENVYNNRRVAAMTRLAPEGLGMMRRIVLANSKESLSATAQRLMEENGIITIPAGSNVLRVMPPLNIPMDDLYQGLNILDEATKNLR